MRKRGLPLFCTIIFFTVTSSIVAQQKDSDRTSDPSPLIRLLQAKGILSEAEAASFSQGDSATENGGLKHG
jgi:hypothetical protein